MKRPVFLVAETEEEAWDQCIMVWEAICALSDDELNIVIKKTKEHRYHGVDIILKDYVFAKYNWHIDSHDRCPFCDYYKYGSDCPLSVPDDRNPHHCDYGCVTSYSYNSLGDRNLSVEDIRKFSCNFLREIKKAISEKRKGQIYSSSD